MEFENVNKAFVDITDCNHPLKLNITVNMYIHTRMHLLLETG